MIGVIQSVLAFLVTLGILVTIHEFGHYLIARWSGVRILRFSVGFGRPFASWTDKRGTEFAVAAIPLGGYLRMWDERDPLGAHSDDSGGSGVSHNQLSPLWKIAIAVGGPLANFILASVVFWFLFVAGTVELLPVLGAPPADTPAAKAGLRGGAEVVAIDGRDTLGWQDVAMKLLDRLGESGEIVITTKRPGALETNDYRLPITNWEHGAKEPEIWDSLGLVRVFPPVIGSVEPGSAAERAGFEVNDLVTAAAGQPVARWEDWVDAVVAHPGKELAVSIERGGNKRTLWLTPTEKIGDAGEARGFAGVGYAQRVVSYGVLEALPMALRETGEKSLSIVLTIKKMLTGAVSTRNLSGPITIAQVAGISAEQGWRKFVQLLALLSLSLGVLNLLPIPMLDGGQIVFFVAELLRGKPLSERVQVIGFQIGIVLVGGLMVLALSNDITRLLGSL